MIDFTFIRTAAAKVFTFCRTVGNIEFTFIRLNTTTFIFQFIIASLDNYMVDTSYDKFVDSDSNFLTFNSV